MRWDPGRSLSGPISACRGPGSCLPTPISEPVRLPSQPCPAHDAPGSRLHPCHARHLASPSLADLRKRRSSGVSAGSGRAALLMAEPIQLAHHGSHPARCVEHRLTHLWRRRDDPSQPQASHGELCFCRDRHPHPPRPGPTFQSGTSFMMMASSSRFSRSICRTLQG
ncbi:unnamed protein product [Gulo gulo]|uniref:Uncharacterized protein n=1 Tax=Gulo gulo TaxID=48420 RepID=A0A9X9M6W3_GULGU|nr:unnamed protein product [Gulo gulo]